MRLVFGIHEVASDEKTTTKNSMTHACTFACQTVTRHLNMLLKMVANKKIYKIKIVTTPKQEKKNMEK